MHNSKIPKSLADTPNETNHTIQVLDPLDAACPLVIPLQLHDSTSYSDVCSPSMSEYENKDIAKIYLVTEEPFWEPSTEGIKKKRLL